MRQLLTLACALVFAASAVSQAQTTRPTNQKKLIEFGWDEPDTAFLRKHIATMEQAPFDGTVFHVSGDFLWKAWSRRAFTEAEFGKAIDDLRNTPLKTFTHNFLRLNVTPGNVDWFDDDFSAITNNALQAAKVARAGKSAGILLDTEQYDFPLFDYRKQARRESKTFDDYANQARRRGREVMNAFQDGFPDLVVLLTYGHTLPCMQVGTDRSKLAGADYGLLAPFLDGMFDAARGGAKIVDGYELSYGYKDPRRFDEARASVFQKVTKIVTTDPQKFRRHASLGFGLWMDYNWRENGWDEKDFSRNYFTPEQFGRSLRKALATADEYVWVYTETPRWWTKPDGKPSKLPQPYLDAVRRARGQGK
jgi:hypothetical protein